MKLYRNLLLSLMAAGALAGVTSCDEKDTLDGAKQVYIEIVPSDISLALGDTIALNATVSNVSGDIIETPVTWSVDDSKVAKLIQDTLQNYYLVSVPFDNLDQEYKTTKVRATLSNDKYAVTNVTVNRGKPKGVMPVDTAGLLLESKQSYMISHDTLVFRVEPKIVLLDYEPTFTIEGEGLAPYDVDPMRVDREAGTVTIHYSAARKAGEGKISVSVGSGNSAMSGSCNIVMLPPIEGATFYGPDFAGMPYIESRPPCHTLRMYYSNTYNKTLDQNKADTVRVAINVQTGAEEDIKEALGTYEWRCVEGSNVLITGMYEDIYPGHGFDAVLIVQTGVEEGTSIFECYTSTDTLAATYTVYNYKERFPVTEVYADSTEIHLVAGMRSIITTYTEPMTSYGYQKPVVTSANEEIATVGEYEGNQIAIRGVSAGETEIILTSYGLEKRIPVYVKEGVSSVSIKDGMKTIFAGQKVEWTLDVRTPNGAENVYEPEWTTTDSKIVVAEPSADNINVGIVTGVGEGKASLRATVLDKSSNLTDVTVVPALTDITLTSGVIDESGSGVIVEDGNVLQLQIALFEDGDFSYKSGIVVNLIDLLSSDDYYGAFNGVTGTAVFDSAVAEVRGGSITIAEDPATADNDEPMLFVTMDLTLYVEGIGEKHLKAQNLKIYAW